MFKNLNLEMYISLKKMDPFFLKNQATSEVDLGVSKNRGTTKMDGENNGKPYEQMDDLGGPTPIFGSTPI